MLDKLCARMCVCCPKLTRGQQLLGWAVCFFFGALLSLSALGSLPSLLIGNPAPFAFKYTIGNTLSLCSYCFLVGPAKQCAGMFAAGRWLITVAYLGSFIATLVCVFYLKQWFLTLVALVAQMVAMVLCSLEHGSNHNTPPPLLLRKSEPQPLRFRSSPDALSYLPSGIGLGMLRRLWCPC